MTFPIGLGAYPSAVLGDLAPTIPRPGVPVLVMGIASNERHDLAASLRGLGCDVTRRHWEPDNQQLDFSQTADSEAARWYGMILGGLNPDAFRAIYARAVGPNEMYGDPTRFSWLAAFELALCRKLGAVGIGYAWGSIQVGCIDPGPFATTFANINTEAAAVCYHLYAGPNNQTLEPEGVQWFARRPLLWFQECQTRGVRMPPLLGGESGTFYPWHPATSSGAYVALLGQISDLLAAWRALGMPVIGHCAFAGGAEGTMGDQWNLDHDALGLIGQHNRGADVDYNPPVAPQPRRQPVSDFTSPNHDGPRGQTLGVVIHATLGHSATPQTEFDSTINWFNSLASQVSAHAVVGPGGQVHRAVRPENVAWHCRDSNATWLGLELAKAHVGDVILPEILDTAAQVVAGWCKEYQIPIVWSTVHGLAEHHEMPTNTDAHVDVGGPFDRAGFLALVQKYAGQGDELTPEQKAAMLDHLNMLWGETTAATIVANPAETERACHERIIAIKTLLGLNG